MAEEFAKVVRDPIYGYVGLTKDQLKVIALPVFQRLRRISQLSFVDLVYPNANHSRLSHSLGAMHLARILAEYLRISETGKQLGLTREDYKAIVWAGLLHDIGHLPFSYACEPAFAHFVGRQMNWKDYHVQIGGEIIRDRSFGIAKVLGKQMADKVCKLIQGECSSHQRALSEAMTGACSVDRLDYLRRDAYHAGTPEYAIVDYNRVLTCLCHAPDAPYVAPSNLANNKSFVDKLNRVLQEELP